jgi:hypothetical protein
VSADFSGEALRIVGDGQSAEELSGSESLLKSVDAFERQGDGVQKQEKQGYGFNFNDEPLVVPALTNCRVLQY